VTGCVIHTGSIDRYGYGHIGRSGLSKAHREAYIKAFGAIPDGKEINHLCRVRACINPDHLEAVTRAEHARRSLSATKTHCVNGHRFDAKNTYVYRGRRSCRPCNGVQVRAYQARTRATRRAS